MDETCIVYRRFDCAMIGEREFHLPQGGAESSPAVERSGTPGTVSAQSCRPVRVGLNKGFRSFCPLYVHFRGVSMESRFGGEAVRPLGQDV